MGYPTFFDAVPPIVIHDPLAEFLGAAEDELIEYRYVDAVKLAGHSCRQSRRHGRSPGARSPRSIETRCRNAAPSASKWAATVRRA